ncbi:MAG: HU family DNA-binding protein [Acidobacteria bacterium]|nr:HU family DNA-binding protein [Acidobacteriota bacterium]
MTNGSLTRAELVEQVADTAALTKKHAEIVVNTVFSSIVETVHRDEKVELPGSI